MKKSLIVLALINVFIFFSCSSSTGTRYEAEKKKSEDIELKKEKKSEVKIIEDFDFTPYRTKLDIPEKEITIPVHIPESDIWYGYENNQIDTSSISNKKIIDKVQGYRVLVLTTDNLDEANNMRSEIYFTNTEKGVYIIFDPPFYKVMVGDFTDYSEAKNLSFKLNQLGYTESRVVNETVNVFE